MAARASARKKKKSKPKKNSVPIIEFQNTRVKVTPMMEQYLAAKRAHPDAILFFRMGDFYELFFDDAVTVHRLLDLTLTARSKGGDKGGDNGEPQADPVPMAGVPVKAVDEYIAALVDKGFRVAVCDQLTSPQKGVAIVRRGITRIVSPGTMIDERAGSAAGRDHRFLAAVAAVPRRGGGIEEELGLAFVDVNTGAFSVTELNGLGALRTEVFRLGIAELLVPVKFEAYFGPLLENLEGICVQRVGDEHFQPKTVLKLIHGGPRDLGELAEESHFLGVDVVTSFFKTVSEYGFRRRSAPGAAVAAVVWYITEMQRGLARHIERITPYRIEDYMVLDEATQSNLELTETIRGGKREGSLLSIIDETVTSAGARRLRTWLSYPLLTKSRIDERLAAVEELVAGYAMRSEVRSGLDDTHDIERLCGRLATGRAGPRDLQRLRHTLTTIPPLKKALKTAKSPMLKRICQDLDPCADIAALIARTMVDEPPPEVREGGVIRAGFNEELDRVVALARSGKDWLLRYEQKQKKATRINSLKVRYSRAFGYYIEITKANLHLVPKNYLRRQTLTNCERYYTPELKEYEEEVLSAEDKRLALELELFEALREQVTAQIGRLRSTASLLATLDVVSSLAHIAHERDYCRPNIREDDVLVIENGRHPVVERTLFFERFVPNDTHLNGTDARLHIITGPNMSGKSTLIRQVAIITLMAQVGSFVPASKAEIGLVDRIFSRVGASDNLARGQSTFMVEMTETAHILQNATARSLIILDEIGRGTSTYDGVSIAWAVAEHLHAEIGARVLFATHYHELTELARTLDGAVNFTVAIKEWEQEIIFLRKLIQGTSNRSYGIQVGRLAGLPQPVVDRANEILHNLELNSYDESGAPIFAQHLEAEGPEGEQGKDGEKVSAEAAAEAISSRVQSAQQQLSLFARGAQAPAPPVENTRDPREVAVFSELEGLQLDTTTPIQALNLLYQWQKKIKKR